MNHPQVATIYPKDAIERARWILSSMQPTDPSTGAYSSSQGYPFVRKIVADFIAKRDGYAACADDIFLTDGASPAVQKVLALLVKNETDGIMIPIPQYPLYSATIPLVGATQVDYYLKETDNWGLSKQELERSWQEAKSRGVSPKAVVVINPGNPTGQCLNEGNIKEIVAFCEER